MWYKSCLISFTPRLIRGFIISFNPSKIFAPLDGNNDGLLKRSFCSKVDMIKSLRIVNESYLVFNYMIWAHYHPGLELYDLSSLPPPGRLQLNDLSLLSPNVALNYMIRAYYHPCRLQLYDLSLLPPNVAFNYMIWAYYHPRQPSTIWSELTTTQCSLQLYDLNSLPPNVAFNYMTWTHYHSI